MGVVFLFIGVSKRLITLIEKRPFVLNIILYNDVLVEIVGQLLGHTISIITEDSYGKIVNKMISIYI